MFYGIEADEAAVRRVEARLAVDDGPGAAKVVRDVIQPAQ